MNTEKVQYTERLLGQSTWWKRLLDVQRPYRVYLQSLKLGFVLDIGCGVGRSLKNLGGCEYGVGIDHNPHSVDFAKTQGLLAYTPQEFQESSFAIPERFDALLLSHVAEHMSHAEAVSLISQHLVYLKPGGKLVIITPQELGYRSDETHVEFVDFLAGEKIVVACGMTLIKQQSFPLPRFCGRWFKYNEFITIGQRPMANNN